MSDTPLKPCPFCNGKAKVKHIVDLPPNHMCQSQTRVLVVCLDCDASCGSQVETAFNNYTPYYSQELNQNPKLRAREEQSYEEYKEDLRTKVCKTWNQRYKDEQPF